MIWQTTGVLVDGNPAAQNFPEAPFRQQLNVPPGSDGRILLSIIFPSGAPVDISSWDSFVLTVKNIYTDGEPPIISRAGLVDDAGSGKVHFTIVEGDTLSGGLNGGPCQYDIWGVDGAGIRNQLVPLSTFMVEGYIGVPATPTPPPTPASNTRKVVVPFDNELEVTVAFDTFDDLGTLQVDISSGPIILGGGDIPAGVAVTALSNGSITATATGNWTGYMVYEVRNT
jgi:hypothetical protein